MHANNNKSKESKRKPGINPRSNKKQQHLTQTALEANRNNFNQQQCKQNQIQAKNTFRSVVCHRRRRRSASSELPSLQLKT